MIGQKRAQHAALRFLYAPHGFTRLMAARAHPETHRRLDRERWERDDRAVAEDYPRRIPSRRMPAPEDDPWFEWKRFDVNCAAVPSLWC